MDDDRILQIRGVPADLYRSLRIESVRREVPLNRLLQDLWDAYQQIQAGQTAGAAAGA